MSIENARIIRICNPLYPWQDYYYANKAYFLGTKPPSLYYLQYAVISIFVIRIFAVQSLPRVLLVPKHKQQAKKATNKNH